MFLNDLIREIVFPLTGFSIFAMIVLTSLNLIIHNKNSEKISSSIQSYGSIVIGSVIIALSFTLAHMYVDSFYNSVSFQNGTLTLAVSATQDKGFPGDGIFIGLFDGISYAIEGLKSLVGFTNIEDLLFNSKGPAFIDEAARNKMMVVYMLFALFAAPMIIIPIVVTGNKYIWSETNKNIRYDAQESMYRWIYSLFLMIAAPIFVFFLLELNSALIDRFSLFKNISISGVTDFTNLQTGSKIITSFVKLYNNLLSIYIFGMFVIRKYIIFVFFAFTAIACILWAINKNVNAASVWFGEMLTNTQMPFFYAFVFSVVTFFLSLGKVTWFELLIVMTMMITLAETLRNSLQGLYQRLSGISETGTLNKAFSAISTGVATFSMFKNAPTQYAQSMNLDPPADNSGLTAGGPTPAPSPSSGNGYASAQTGSFNVNRPGVSTRTGTQAPSSAGAAGPDVASAGSNGVPSSQYTPNIPTGNSSQVNVASTPMSASSSDKYPGGSSSLAPTASAGSSNDVIHQPDAEGMERSKNSLVPDGERGVAYQEAGLPAVVPQNNAIDEYYGIQNNPIEAPEQQQFSSPQPGMIYEGQHKLKRELGNINAASNIIGKAVAIPLALAAAPLGRGAVDFAMNVGQGVSSVVRAAATPIAAFSTVNHMRKKHNLSTVDAMKVVTNSNDNIGAVMKIGSLTSGNISSSGQGMKQTLDEMNPSNDKHYARLLYSPATANPDSFRFDDKMFSQSDAKKDNANKKRSSAERGNRSSSNNADRSNNQQSRQVG